jgi:hypothetical protein
VTAVSGLGSDPAIATGEPAATSHSATEPSSAAAPANVEKDAARSWRRLGPQPVDGPVAGDRVEPRPERAELGSNISARSQSARNVSWTTSAAMPGSRPTRTAAA